MRPFFIRDRRNRYASRVGETFIIINPNAQGGRIQKHIPAIRAIADRAHARVHLSTSVSDSNALLRNLATESRVIVAGGDGTVQHLLAVLAEKQHRLGILPLGSGNDGARALGTFAGDWQDTLARLLATQHTRAVDLGLARFDGRVEYFLVALNAGFDAAIARCALIGPKFLHGLPRYLLATLRELVGLTHWTLTLDLDGHRVHVGETLFASTLNAATYGSGMPAVPHAKCDDGALDLLIARRFSRVSALLMLPRLLRGTHLTDHRVSTHAFTTLALTSSEPIPLAADGEFLGSTRALTVSLNARQIMALA